MDSVLRISPLVLFIATLLLTCKGGEGATFTFANKCEYTVWPGILANAGSPSLDSTGFELPTGSSRSFQAPTSWSGRFWGRTGCSFDSDSGAGSCLTADCGSGHVECSGLGASPPATLAEFTLGSAGGQDFYDVSLVDGYNVPMLVEGSGGCASTGCSADLNLQCPEELRAGEGVGACKSACEAFGSPEYCCSGAFNSPATCRPSVYSEMFKAACPKSYSYAYDDATSTFTCSGADYTVTFCPSSTSQKSSSYSTPMTSTSTSTTPGDSSGSESSGVQYSGTGYVSENGAGSGSGTTSSSSGEAMLADGSWLAGLAMGGSDRTASPSYQHSLLTALASAICLIVALANL